MDYPRQCTNSHHYVVEKRILKTVVSTNPILLSLHKVFNNNGVWIDKKMVPLKSSYTSLNLTMLSFNRRLHKNLCEVGFGERTIFFSGTVVNSPYVFLQIRRERIYLLLGKTGSEREIMVEAEKRTPLPG